MPKVSVIIPCYNSERFIRQTLESVLSQTFNDLEIIVVDDGSTDSTADIVNSFKDNRIVYHYKANQGLSSARNKGISLSQGEYIAFLDHDDIWLPEKLKIQLEVFTANQEAAMVFSDAYITDLNGKRIKRFFKISPPFKGKVFNKLLSDNFVPILTVMLKRTVFEKTGLFNSNYKIAEDWDFFLRLAKNYSFDYINTPLAEYRVHDASFSKNAKLALEESLDLMQRYLTEFNRLNRRIIKNKISELKLQLGSIYFHAGEILTARKQFLDSIRNNSFNFRSYLGICATILPNWLAKIVQPISLKRFHG